MYARMLITAGIAALVAAPLAAQQRGTVEFGAFASRTSYDAGLGMNSNTGFGGRIGAYLAPRLAIEFEAGGGKASRTLGRADVNTSVLTGRLTLVPLKLGHSVSILLGAGVDHQDTHFFESYGPNVLLGVKLALSQTVSLRLDGIDSWLANGGGMNKSLHLGLSMYRLPANRVSVVYRDGPPTTVVQNDSVSAEETRRLRAIAASYQMLRDSLGRPTYVTPGVPSSAAALATMQQMVLFSQNSTELTPESKTTLDAKVGIFRDNPEMRIVITGFASQPGDSAYNMALGLRRAEVTKAYLVSRGVAPVRIEIATKGEGQLLVAGPLDMDQDNSANVANRRSQFRLLVADPYLIAPSTKTSSSHN